MKVASERSSEVLGLDVLEGVLAKTHRDHGFDDPVQREEVLLEGRFDLQPAEHHPVQVGREVHGHTVEQAREAVGEDPRDKQVLSHALLVAFEFGEISFGTIPEVPREKPFHELEKPQNAHDFEISENFDGLDPLEHRISPGIGHQVKRERRHQVDPEPELEVALRDQAPRCHPVPLRVLEAQVEVDDNIDQENHRRDVLADFEEEIAVFDERQFKRKHKEHIDQKHRNQGIPRASEGVLRHEQESKLLRLFELLLAVGVHLQSCRLAGLYLERARDSTWTISFG